MSGSTRRSTARGSKKPAAKAALGLPAASALVIGSIIGTGVFALPSALAPYGPISLVAFVAVTLGALALAMTFGAFNASGQSALGAVSAAAAIALFSYLGLEAASVVAGRVREQGRNVPHATVYGTVVCASRASRSSPSPVPNWDAVGADHGA